MSDHSDLWVWARRLRANFSQSTSELPDQWTPGNPSVGHCHVAALCLQDWYGGHVLEGHAQGDMVPLVQQHAGHYWNLIDGIEIDITRDQFTVGVSFCHIRFADPALLVTRQKAELLAIRAGS